MNKLVKHIQYEVSNSDQDELISILDNFKNQEFLTSSELLDKKYTSYFLWQVAISNYSIGKKEEYDINIDTDLPEGIKNLIVEKLKSSVIIDDSLSMVISKFILLFTEISVHNIFDIIHNIENYEVDESKIEEYLNYLDKSYNTDFELRKIQIVNHLKSTFEIVKENYLFLKKELKRRNIRRFADLTDLVDIDTEEVKNTFLYVSYMELFEIDEEYINKEIPIPLKLIS